MKQCPVCKATYTDDTLSFCLEDGSLLVLAADEQPTVYRAGGKETLRVEVPETKAVAAASPDARARPAGNTWVKVLAAVVILGIVGLAALGLAGAAIYYSSGPSTPDPTPVPKTPTPRPSPSPTADPEKERLRDEFANLEKWLEEQRRDRTPSNTDDDDRSSSVTGTVNSPNDGFLALRNIPDADRGVRLAKIPHGAEVDILNCEKTSMNISGRSGRWCQVEYNGRIGWVFDAWLDY